ncbi:uncharacterized protein LOC115433377 [Sphaeramia orbicularis]|uniref:uncharacterized protein LOC115433377 n=1 Tax=Sphaeramia orbicularis TaxID=375764 RepID=UPI001181112D|nr:uncharacterized protein LOC115433377 [Sphaeramia orbicularis]
MDGERESIEECTESKTSNQPETVTENCTEDSNTLQEPEGDNRANSGARDGEVQPTQWVKAAEDPCVSDAETTLQETLNVQNDADCLPLSPPQTEEKEEEEEEEGVTSHLVSPHPSSSPKQPPEPCWYCLRSLDSEYRPHTPLQQEEADSSSPLPSSGQKVIYQTDPRPHFGVAFSSRSTCRPLWGSEGPCWGQRNQEAPKQTHTCPHCHLGLPADTLRWHEAKCLLFEELRNAKK